MRKGLFTTFLLTLFCFALNAQVKVSATPSGRHADAIKTAKKSRQDVQEQRERARQIRDQKKAFKKYKNGYAKLKKRRLSDFKQDSLSVGEIEAFSKEDSLAIANEVLEDLPLEYRELVQNPLDLDSLAMSSLEEPTSIVSESVLESQVKGLMPEELNQPGTSGLENLPTDPLAGASNPTTGLSPTAIKKPTRPNPNLVKPEMARDLFKKIDPEQFQKVQGDISKLKDKYSQMPDSRFPEEGKKRNSLEDVPFSKRLHVGGTINLPSTDPVILDVSLQFGYWINKKWMAGVSISMREQFNQRDSTSVTGDAHGFSFFTQYDILKQFYVWGEMQQQVNRGLINNETVEPTKWERAHLVGIGRDFSIGPIRMSSLILYDFNYQNNSLNSRPWVFRLGFNFTKKP